MDFLRLQVKFASCAPLASSTCSASTTLLKFDLDEPPPAAAGGPHRTKCRRALLPSRPSMFAVAGRLAAESEKLVRRRKRQTSDRYPDIEFVNTVKRRRKGMPWASDELAEFEKSLIAPTTQIVRQCHKRTVAQILLDEFHDGIPVGQNPETILEQAAKTPEAVMRVGATLAERGISSTSNYLSSWASTATFSPEAERIRCKLLRRVGQQFGRHQRGQSTDFDLTKILAHEQFLDALPSRAASAVFPFQVTSICALLMFRGITARSLMRTQVRFFSLDNTSVVELLIGFRKGYDSNKNLRRLPLICSCPSTCPHCLVRSYVSLRDKRVGAAAGSLFCTQRGGPVAKAAFAHMIQFVCGVGAHGRPPTPHACRISGARFWAYRGVTEGVIADLGDWKDLKTLRRYLGGITASRRLQSELGRLAQPDVVAPLPMLSSLAEATIRNLAFVPEPASMLALVCRRRWHKLHMTGPSRHWTSLCGTRYNPSTMFLQRWGEHDNRKDEICDLCSR